MLHNHRRQRGEGRLGLMIALGLFASGIFLGAKIIPVRIDAYEFNNTLREEARYASVHRDDDNVLKRILDTAEEREIPLDPKNLNIRRTKAEVIVSAKYEVPIDLKLTTYTYKFNGEQRAPLF